jgi:hypothetical protein
MARRKRSEVAEVTHVAVHTAPVPVVEKKHGGKRPGSGRPVTGERFDGYIMMRCSAEQKNALQAYVDKLSKEREAAGKPAVALTTWLRELALATSGNGQLGEAGRAARMTLFA